MCRTEGQEDSRPGYALAINKQPSTHVNIVGTIHCRTSSLKDTLTEGVPDLAKNAAAKPENVAKCAYKD